jgi:hypothetical protein
MRGFYAGLPFREREKNGLDTWSRRNFGACKG